MNNKINHNKGLRVRSKSEKELDFLLVSALAVMPYLHFIASAAVMLTVFFSVLVIKCTRRAVLAQRQLNVITAAIVLLSLVSSLISGNYIGVLITLGVLSILTLAAYLTTVMTRELFDRVIFISAIGGIFTACIVVAQRITFKDPGHRPYGWSFNANYLGSVAVLSAIFAFVKLFEAESFENVKALARKKVLYFISMMCDIATILICESRSSLLAIMACIVAFVFLKKQYVLCILGVLGAIGLWVLGWFYPQFFSWSNSLIEVFTVRADIWKDAIGSFMQSPYTFLIGRGPMTYLHVMEKESLCVAHHAHNIFIDTLINVGVVGFVFYALLIGLFAYRMVLSIRRGDRTSFIYVALAVIAVLVQGLADVTIMWHQTAVLFVLMCASVRCRNESDNK